jgi:hypothetical protein
MQSKILIKNFFDSKYEEKSFKAGKSHRYFSSYRYIGPYFVSIQNTIDESHAIRGGVGAWVIWTLKAKILTLPHVHRKLLTCDHR